MFSNTEGSLLFSQRGWFLKLTPTDLGAFGKGNPYIAETWSLVTFQITRYRPTRQDAYLAIGCHGDSCTGQDFYWQTLHTLHSIVHHRPDVCQGAIQD